jgi:hypothetical protein
MISSALMVAGHISEETYVALRGAADLIERQEAALESRDQRIRELERAAMDVILSDEYGDHHVPNHDALAALFPNIKRGYWP